MRARHSECKPEQRRSFRQRVREVMEPYAGNSDSTRLSLVVDLLVIFLIFFSCALIPLEIIVSGHEMLFFWLEAVITGIFIVEYLLRWYGSENRFKYPFDKFAMVDLIAILPSLLLTVSHLAASQFRILRIVRGMRLLRMLRFLRLIRLLRLLRYGNLLYMGVIELRINFVSISHTFRLKQLFRIFVVTFIIWIVGANLLYLTETLGSDGPLSDAGNRFTCFRDYWDSYWNIVIMLISGIEDKEPGTLMGRIEAVVVLIAGVIIVGVFTGEIVTILVRRLQRAGLVRLMPPGSWLFTKHIIILGNSEHLDNIVRHVNDAVKGQHFIVVVSPDAEDIKVTDPLVYKKVFALSGDPTDRRVLAQANIDKASRIIILSPRTETGELNRDNRALMVTIAASLAHNVPTVVEINRDESLNYAGSLERVEYVNGKEFGERLISQAVLNRGVTRIYSELMNFTLETNEFYSMDLQDELLGKTFKEIQLHFMDRDDEAIVPVGFERRSGQGEYELMMAPGSGLNDVSSATTMVEGDRLIVMAFDRPAMGKGEDTFSSTYLEGYGEGL